MRGFLIGRRCRGIARCGLLLAGAVTHVSPAPGPRELKNIWEENTIWIEDSPKGGLVLRFGVFGALAETSPGNLDRLPSLTAWKPRDAGRSTPLDLKKAADHFLIEGADSKTSVQAEDLSITVRHEEAGGYLGRKPVLYARWQPAALSAPVPRLTLDLVPAEGPGTFRVYFRGRPLPGAKVQAFGPTGFAPQELVTNPEGITRFTPSLAGLYQLLCSHVEPGPVYVVGYAYKGTRHVSTLTWRHP